MSAETVLEIKKLARKFVQDNYRFPSAVDYRLTENAMMIAVTHVTSGEVEDLRAIAVEEQVGSCTGSCGL